VNFVVGVSGVGKAVASMAMAWFGLMHCAGSLGPPREVRW